MVNNKTALFEDILIALGDLHRCFATTRDHFLSQFSLTRPQLELLLYIRPKEKTVSQIADAFSITSSAVSQMVDQLEKRRLVERVRSTKDKRVYFIRVAPQARKIFAAMRDKYVDHLESKFAEVTDDDLHKLLAILTNTINTVDHSASE